MHHGRRGRDGEDVPRHFNGAFLRLPVYFLHALGMRDRANVPDVAQNCACVALQKRSELAVISPGARDGAFVNFAFGRAEARRFRR